MWVVTAALVANSMPLIRASQTYVLALRWPRLRSLPTDLVCRQILSDVAPKGCLESRATKISKSVGRYFVAVDVKGPGEAAVKLYCPFQACVEGFNHALGLWWEANLRKDLEETVSADKIKRLCEVSESDIQGHLFFSTFHLELAKREDHVYC